MSDLPKSVHIFEQGTREGFQFDKGIIPTARKVELVDTPGCVMKGGTLREKARVAA